MSQVLARKRALRSLARRLGLRKGAPDWELLNVALTHDSYSSEHVGRVAAPVSNERLEFLGDAVLGAAAAHALYRRYPDKPEGKLSRLRAALVSRAALAQTAERLAIAPLLLLGRGEGAAGGAHRPSILAGAFEALVGAAYVSEGFEAARRFVERHHLVDAKPSEATDPKSALQEYAQAKFKKAPHYAVTAQVGPPHARTFTVAVAVAGQMISSGNGATKKQAEAAAAQEALENIGRWSPKILR